MWIQVTHSTWIQITPVVFLTAFPVLAGLIIWLTVRFVRRANRKINGYHSETVRAETKTADAQRAAIIAHEDNVRLTDLADKAVTHRAHDVKVEQTLDHVSDQMGALIEFIAEGLSPVRHGRHARDPLADVQDAEASQ